MASIDLPGEPDSVRAARAFIYPMLRTRGLDPFIVGLLTSELAANVVRHAQTGFTLAVSFGLAVRVEVHDGVAATVAFGALMGDPPRAEVSASGGRGLGLVRALATRYGLADEPGRHNGKVVWFEVDHDALNAGKPPAV